MKKTLIAAIAFAFAAVSFAAQTPAKPDTSNAGQTTNSTPKPKVKTHHRSTKKSTKSSTAAPVSK